MNAILPFSPERRGWRCIRSKHRSEGVAKANLENIGHRVYLPVFWCRVGKRYRVLFPDYLFCIGIPPSGTRGVAEVLFGGERVPDRIVDGVREVEALWDQPEWKTGDAVEVAGYEGWIGEVLSVDDSRQRAYVLLRLLSRAVKTDVALTRLRGI